MPLTENEPLQEMIQTLAAMPPTEFPFISAYVDLTPELHSGTRVYTAGNDEAPLKSPDRHAAQERGPIRPAIREMHDRLRYKDSAFGESGSERESYDADKAKILEYLETDAFDDQAKGVAIFACAGQDVWHVVELAVPVPTRLYVARSPLLFPLAQAMAEYERFALVVAETEAAHIYVVALGQTEIEETLDGPKVNRSQKGGLSQKRFQERTENAVTGQVRRTAERLEQLVAEENINYIVLSGDVTALSEFKSQLRQDTLDKVVAMESSQANIPKAEAIRSAMEAVLAAEQSDARDLARQARDNALAENLGTFGEHAVRYALEQGAVHILLMSADFASTTVREEFTEAALATSAQLEFIEDSEDLRRMHGVAAILRFRPMDLPEQPGIRHEVTPENETDDEALAKTNRDPDAPRAAHPTPAQNPNPDKNDE